MLHIFRQRELGHILEKLVRKMMTELTWHIEWLLIILEPYHLPSRMALVLVCSWFLVSFTFVMVYKNTNVLVFDYLFELGMIGLSIFFLSQSIMVYKYGFIFSCSLTSFI